MKYEHSFRLIDGTTLAFRSRTPVKVKTTDQWFVMPSIATWVAAREVLSAAVNIPITGKQKT